MEKKRARYDPKYDIRVFPPEDTSIFDGGNPEEPKPISFCPFCGREVDYCRCMYRNGYYFVYY